jgi:hypothetical protein
MPLLPVLPKEEQEKVGLGRRMPSCQYYRQQKTLHVIKRTMVH